MNTIVKNQAELDSVLAAQAGKSEFEAAKIEIQGDWWEIVFSSHVKSSISVTGTVRSSIRVAGTAKMDSLIVKGKVLSISIERETQVTQITVLGFESEGGAKVGSIEVDATAKVDRIFIGNGARVEKIKYSGSSHVAGTGPTAPLIGGFIFVMDPDSSVGDIMVDGDAKVSQINVQGRVSGISLDNKAQVKWIYVGGKGEVEGITVCGEVRMQGDGHSGITVDGYAKVRYIRVSGTALVESIEVDGPVHQGIKANGHGTTSIVVAETDTKKASRMLGVVFPFLGRESLNPIFASIANVRRIKVDGNAKVSSIKVADTRRRWWHGPDLWQHLYPDD